MERANQALHNTDTDPILGSGGRDGDGQPEKCFTSSISISMPCF